MHATLRHGSASVKTTLDGRQEAPWGNEEDRRAIAQAVADNRSEQRHHQALRPCLGPAGHLAGCNAGAQADDAGAGAGLALANKKARIVWALMARGGVCQSAASA